LGLGVKDPVSDVNLSQKNIPGLPDTQSPSVANTPATTKIPSAIQGMNLPTNQLNLPGLKEVGQVSSEVKKVEGEVSKELKEVKQIEGATSKEIKTISNEAGEIKKEAGEAKMAEKKMADAKKEVKETLSDKEKLKEAKKTLKKISRNK